MEKKSVWERLVIVIQRTIDGTHQIGGGEGIIILLIPLLKEKTYGSSY